MINNDEKRNLKDESRILNIYFIFQADILTYQLIGYTCILLFIFI